MKKELLTVKELAGNSVASTALNCRKLLQTA